VNPTYIGQGSYFSYGKADPVEILKLFLNAIGSEVTKKAYKYHLDRFLKWNKIKSGNYDNLLKADEKVIQRNLEDYLIHLKDKNASPNYIPVILALVELFYLMNEFNINSKRLHKMYPNKVEGGYGAFPFWQNHLTFRVTMISELSRASSSVHLTSFLTNSYDSNKEPSALNISTMFVFGCTMTSLG